MKTSKLEAMAPLGAQELRENLEYLGAVSLNIDLGKSTIEMLRELVRLSGEDCHLYKRHPESFCEAFKKISFKGDSSRIDLSSFSDEEFRKMLKASSFVTPIDSQSNLIKDLMSCCNFPFILSNPSTSYGKKAQAKAKKIAEQGIETGVLFTHCSDNLSVVLYAKKEDLMDLYCQAIDLCVEKEAELKVIENSYYTFRITVKNKDIDRKKFKCMGDFWDAVEEELKPALENEHQGIIYYMDYKSPYSSATISMPEKYLHDNFSSFCGTLRGTSVPKSTLLWTSSMPKNWIIRKVYERPLPIAQTNR